MVKEETGYLVAQARAKRQVLFWGGYMYWFAHATMLAPTEEKVHVGQEYRMFAWLIICNIHGG